MTATHSPGCPALDDPRDGCACLLQQMMAPLLDHLIAAQGDHPWRGLGEIGAGDGFISESDHCAEMEELAAAARFQIQEATDHTNDREYHRGHRDAYDEVIGDLSTRILREVMEKDADGLLDGLRYALGCVSLLPVNRSQASEEETR